MSSKVMSTQPKKTDETEVKSKTPETNEKSHIIISDDDMLDPKELQNQFSEKFSPDFNKDMDSKLIGNLIKESIPHMDKNNKKAAQVMLTGGMDEAVKYMFQHPTEKINGKPRQMSYGEMRMHYG